VNVFALIPGFSGYQIDTTGCVHRFSTGEMAFGYRDANGYTPTPTPYRGYLIRMADLSGSEL
jgi:hypothetical protein